MCYLKKIPSAFHAQIYFLIIFFWSVGVCCQILRGRNLNELKQTCHSILRQICINDRVNLHSGIKICIDKEDIKRSFSIPWKNLCFAKSEGERTVCTAKISMSGPSLGNDSLHVGGGGTMERFFSV